MRSIVGNISRYDVAYAKSIAYFFKCKVEKCLSSTLRHESYVSIRNSRGVVLYKLPFRHGGTTSGIKMKMVHPVEPVRWPTGTPSSTWIPCYNPRGIAKGKREEVKSIHVRTVCTVMAFLLWRMLQFAGPHYKFKSLPAGHTFLTKMLAV